MQEAVSLSLCHRRYVSRVSVVDGAASTQRHRTAAGLGSTLCVEGFLKLLLYPLGKADLE